MMNINTIIALLLLQSFGCIAAAAEGDTGTKSHDLVGLRPLPGDERDHLSNHGRSWAGTHTYAEQKGNSVQTHLQTTAKGSVVAADASPDTIITVRSAAELRKEVRRAKPGTTIRLARGNYGHGIRIERLQGTQDMPIIITGADRQNPPVFEGGKNAIHFVSCSYIILRNILVTGCQENGINADDGGRHDSPSIGMIFDQITIEHTGPTGNHDSLKLSGVDQFSVKNCIFRGWGGSAIDMVGCHEGLIDQCRFMGKEGYSQASGIQVKGGSENIRIRRCFFRDAGQRAVNLGGSTGLPYFRPEVRDYEARNVIVEGNHFVGSLSPIAFATSTDCRVRRNTIIYPEKWVLRILQEQSGDRFKPCQKGVFESNLVVVDQRVRTFVNIGPKTLPDTFSFRRNAWFCSDSDRRPSLPSEEVEGLYQIDPMLQQTETSDMKILSKDSRLEGIGAQAFSGSGTESNEQGTSKNVDKLHR